MLTCDRPSDSIRLDMSRPVLITHFTPCCCKRPMRICKSSGTGGFSNSANTVPSKSVEMILIGGFILVAAWRVWSNQAQFRRHNTRNGIRSAISLQHRWLPTGRRSCSVLNSFCDGDMSNDNRPDPLFVERKGQEKADGCPAV